MLNSIRAEWTKLTTTKAIYWTSFLVLFFAIGGSALYAFTMRIQLQDQGIDQPLFLPALAFAMFQSLSLPVIIVQAAMIYTSEYRHNIATSTFSATPQRWLPVAGKTVVLLLWAAVMAALSIAGSYYAGINVADPSQGAQFKAMDDFSARAVWVYPLITVLIALLVLGIALLVRQTAGTIVIAMLWFMVIDNLLAALPKIGAHLAAYLPFTNMNAFISQQPLEHGVDASQSIWIFAAWAVGVFALGLVSLYRRDV